MINVGRTERSEFRLALRTLDCRNSSTPGPTHEDCERTMFDPDIKSSVHRLMLIALLFAVMCSTAFAQKANKPKGGMKPGKPNQGMRGAGGGNQDKKEQLLARKLPTAFQGLPDAEVLLLSKLCQRSVSWMNRDELPEPTLSSVASVFGHFQAESTSATEAASQSSNARATQDARLEETGLLVLTKLNLDQRRALAKVMPEQDAEIKESLALRSSLVSLIAAVRDQKSANRSAEGEARKSLRELSRLETSIAARQARAFAELNESLSIDQRESLQLICHSPIETKPSGEAVKELEEELQDASAEVKVAFRRLAAHAALWIGMDSLPTAAAMDFELPSTNTATSDQFLPTYLTALSPTQQKELISLLAGRVRAETQATAAQQQVQAILIGLRTNRSLDERQLHASMEANFEAMYFTSRAEAAAFEQLMNSLSKAQREHFASTLNIQFSSDKPIKKPSKGKS